MPNDANQKLIITHAVLTGLTPLVPIPFVDDLLKSYFQRRLVRKLSERYGKKWSEQEIKTLADDPDKGCLVGCLSNVLLFPFKLLFRLIFFFLEWKRAVDTVSRNYHRGYLFECVLQEGQNYQNVSAAEIRAAIDAVCSAVGTSPVEQAVRAVIGQSKGVLKSAAGLLKKTLKNIPGRPDEERVARAAEQVEAEEERRIEDVTARLQKSIQNVPAEYFQDLRSRLAARLKRPQ